eukprot:986340-Pelagomonas_calceolata.AAC.1
MPAPGAAAAVGSCQCTAAFAPAAPAAVVAGAFWTHKGHMPAASWRSRRPKAAQAKDGLLEHSVDAHRAQLRQPLQQSSEGQLRHRAMHRQQPCLPLFAQ